MHAILGLGLPHEQKSIPWQECSGFRKALPQKVQGMEISPPHPPRLGQLSRTLAEVWLQQRCVNGLNWFVHVHVHVHVHVYVYVYVHVHVHVYVYVCMYVCMYVRYMYV